MSRQFVNKIHICSLIAVIILTAGCTGPRHQLYDGPPRPVNEIALLYGYHPSNHVVIHAVDGKFGPSRGGRFKGEYQAYFEPVEIELLPGMHTVTVSYQESLYDPFGSGTCSDTTIDLKFQAEAGKCYYVIPNLDYSKNISPNPKRSSFKWTAQVKEHARVKK